MAPRGGNRPGAGRKPLPPGEKGKKGKGVQIWLPPELSDWSADYAKSRNISRSKLIADALEALRAASTAELTAAHAEATEGTQPLRSAPKKLSG